MGNSSDSARCPICGGPIPAEASHGLCPKCLLLQASIPTESGSGPSPKPLAPAIAELAAAFPQLEVLELIGQGGMGFVFKARQPKIDRVVALKILPQSLAGDPAFAERFTREARMLARLNHPNIVTIHDFGQAGGFFYLLMEFVDGVNLRQAMKAGRFTPAQALAIVPKICDALQFAHDEGVLHRDIKPENILLDARGRVKIADFGIAKLGGTGIARVGGATGPADVALTETGRALGTPHYMAPEQLERPQEVDERADIFSLGVVFYEMLTGGLPIGRFAPPSEKSAVDPRIDEVVMRTLEKERERRQRSAGEVKTQVETIAVGGQSSTPKRPASVPPDRFWKRMAVVMALLCVILVLLIASFARFHFGFKRVATNPPLPWEVVGGTLKPSAALIMDTLPTLSASHQDYFKRFPDSHLWEFKYLIPAEHLLQLVFVEWSNGVPAIEPGLSGYFKVGPRPVNVESMAITCDPHPFSDAGRTNVVQWNVAPGFHYTVSGWITNQPPFRQLETAPRFVLHPGGQLAIRLAEFAQPAGSASNGWSGVELRLILQPLSSPAVQTDSEEMDFTNYVAGWGLEAALADSIKTALSEESVLIRTQNSQMKQAWEKK